MGGEYFSGLRGDPKLALQVVGEHHMGDLKVLLKYKGSSALF